MYQGVFKRVEEKYMLTKEQKDAFVLAIQEFVRKDKYFENTICSIYFDNSSSDIIVKSIDKPLFKEKFRLRSYGIPTLDDTVFLEIKSKYKGVTGKRRTALTLREFYDYQETHKASQDTQIMHEIEYCFDFYHLQPAYFIAYDREAYRGIENDELRITIDSNLRSRTDNLRLELGDEGEKYFDDDIYMLEIKTLGSIPIWLVHILSKLKLFPAAFSKYGNIYMKHHFEFEAEEEETC